MKKDIHPKNYRPVIFLDNASGARFLLDSTVETKEEDVWEDGKTYPLFRVDISSASHPFYTGAQSVVDTAGRVQKFTRRRTHAEAVQKKRAEIETRKKERVEKRAAEKKKKKEEHQKKTKMSAK